MKKTLLLASCLIGLNLVAVAGEDARSFNRTNDLSVNKSETLSEVITSLIRKDAQVKSASAASLTISILEDFQNNKTEFLKVSETEKAVFNQTIKTISEQGQNFSDVKTLNWIKEKGIVTPTEYTMSKDALWWAAMTYVVAALGMLAQLLYYLNLLNGRSRD